MIDAKKAFKKILREWGHDVYIQRILSNGNHSAEIERVTTRNIGQSGLANANSTQEMPEGLSTAYDAVYYFEDSINPKEGDRIYENYSAINKRAYTMYSIDTVTAVRGRLGKIVYWIAGATRER